MQPSLTFTVTQLNCAACAKRASDALARVDGLEAATVNFANGRAEVQGDAKASDIVDALSQRGYPAALERVTLLLLDMSCASCVGRVRAALEAIPNVVSVEVNLASGRADVEVFQGSDKTALLEVVRRAGYGADLVGHAAAPLASERQANAARDQTKRAIIAAFLALPVVIFEMGGHIVPAVHHWLMQTLGQSTTWSIQFVLTTLVLVWPGAQFFRRGVPALMRRAPDMNALVALGTGAAWMFSTVALFAPWLLPLEARVVYFEAAAVIVALILAGRALEARAKGQTGAAIEALMDLSSPVALLVTDAGPKEVDLHVVQKGDVLRVMPGAQVPLDGHVVSGESAVNEAMLTGEPLPVFKGLGSAVFGGTLNGENAFDLKVSHGQNDTVLARIIAAVESAQNARLPVQDLVDRITAVFVPFVLLVAVVTFTCWLLAGGGFDRALISAVSVLVVACPCAMGLAVPMSIMVGTGRGAEIGVLFRGGAGLQRAAGVAVVGFDKTGTLTEGQPQVRDVVIPEGGPDQAGILAGLAALEQHSNHPVAQAIIDAYKQKTQGAVIETAHEVQSRIGRGIEGIVGDVHWAVGNRQFVSDLGADPETMARAVSEAEARGHTVLYATKNKTLAALIVLADQLKPASIPAVAALDAMGLDTLLISGDTQAAASHAATLLGIRTAVGGVSPEGKVAALNAAAGGASAAFVGDGINDAPVLASADLGIALGSGTDVAVESADVVLMRGDPMGVPTALGLSRAVMRNIRQNLFWAFAYNLALIPVAAGAFVWAGVAMQPAFAGLAMALSSVFVVTNALRLRRWRPVEPLQ